MHHPRKSFDRTVFLSVLLLSSLALPIHGAESTRPASDRLTPFLDQFSRIASVHLEAKAIIQLETPEGARTGRGSFSYWEQGNRFRIRCETDDNLGLMGDIQWSYDGEKSLLWLLESNTVTKNTSLDQEAPTALPNPFFLPVGFLFDANACPTCRASLDQVVQARDRWEAHVVQDGMTLRLETEESTDGSPRLVELVELDEPMAHMWVPGTITQTLPDQDSRVIVRLSSYESTDDFIFPRSITVTTWASNEDAILRMELLITELEIDRPLPEESFTTEGNEQSTFIFSGDEAQDIQVP